MKITNNHNLPEPLYRTVCHAVEKYEGPSSKDVLDKKKISVTTLINPPRLTMLRAMHEDKPVDASDLLYLVTGISFHYMVSDVGFSTGSEYITERRVDREHRGWLISGQFDVLGNGAIADWKWTSVWSLTGPKFEWDAQLNLYRWLAKAEGAKVDRLLTWAMLRDWSHVKHLKDKRIPPIPFAEIEKNIWADEVVESYINDRLDLYQNAVDLVKNSGDPNTVPVCTEEERWQRGRIPVRCQRYCDVAEYCAFGKAQLEG